MSDTESELRPFWPAMMRPDTLRAYLDCRSDSDFSRMMAKLRKRGYPGIDPIYNRHIKEIVDRYLPGEHKRRRSGEAEALAALDKSA